MKVTKRNNDIILDDFKNFDLKKTFECGQCFRWNETGPDEYTGVIFEKVLKITQKGNTFTFHDTSEEFFYDKLIDYFDLKTDYSKIDKIINTDDHMAKCIEYGNGIRMLKQELFETTLSFIISANNNIPRIKKIINSLCLNHGKPIEYEGNTYYSFPDANALRNVKIEDYRNMGTGFRDKYLFDAVNKFNSGNLNLNEIRNADTDTAKKLLMSIKGIGEKVSNCILLFSLYRIELFPIDVWIRKILENRYNMDNVTFEKGAAFAEDKWGEYAGIAQQYLFYFEREGS